MEAIEVEEIPVKHRNLRVTITQGSCGHLLKKPIIVQVPVARSKVDKAVNEYVISSLSWRMPSLLPFAFQNRSILKMAEYLYRYRSKSHGTLYKYVYTIHRYCLWCGKTPDQLIQECKDPTGVPKPEMLYRHTRLLDNYLGYLQTENLALSTVSNYVKGVKTLYTTNGLELKLPYTLPKRVTYRDRAPRPEELQRLIDMADLRGKVVVSCLALGGFREGTLAALKYYHIREDLERGVTPIHVHVEAEITKGKYHDYDTFLGREAVDYIKAYLDMRRRGTPRQYTPPEEINDESPLIRNKHSRKVSPVRPSRLYYIVHNLYLQAGLIRKKRGFMYTLRPHSIRKFFRTQLAALGVNRDYIDYMMGHKVSTYHDIQMKGIEFLRNIYITSGLSIRPKTRLSKIQRLKDYCTMLGLNPEEYLTKNALAEPHRTYASTKDHEEDLIHELRELLKEALRQELLDKTIPNRVV